MATPKSAVLANARVRQRVIARLAHTTGLSTVRTARFVDSLPANTPKSRLTGDMTRLTADALHWHKRTAAEEDELEPDEDAPEDVPALDGEDIDALDAADEDDGAEDEDDLPSESETDLHPGEIEGIYKAIDKLRGEVRRTDRSHYTRVMKVFSKLEATLHMLAETLKERPHSRPSNMRRASAYFETVNELCRTLFADVDDITDSIMEADLTDEVMDAAEGLRETLGLDEDEPTAETSPDGNTTNQLFVLMQACYPTGSTLDELAQQVTGTTPQEVHRVLLDLIGKGTVHTLKGGRYCLTLKGRSMVQRFNIVGRVLAAELRMAGGDDRDETFTEWANGRKWDNPDTGRKVMWKTFSRKFPEKAQRIKTQWKRKHTRLMRRHEGARIPEDAHEARQELKEHGVKVKKRTKKGKDGSREWRSKYIPDDAIDKKPRVKRGPKPRVKRKPVNNDTLETIDKKPRVKRGPKPGTRRITRRQQGDLSRSDKHEEALNSIADSHPGSVTDSNILDMKDYISSGNKAGFDRYVRKNFKGKVRKKFLAYGEDNLSSGKKAKKGKKKVKTSKKPETLSHDDAKSHIADVFKGMRRRPKVTTDGQGSHYVTKNSSDAYDVRSKLEKSGWKKSDFKNHDGAMTHRYTKGGQTVTVQTEDGISGNGATHVTVHKGEATPMPSGGGRPPEKTPEQRVKGKKAKKNKPKAPPAKGKKAKKNKPKDYGDDWDDTPSKGKKGKKKSSEVEHHGSAKGGKTHDKMKRAAREKAKQTGKTQFTEMIWRGKPESHVWHHPDGTATSIQTQGPDGDRYRVVKHKDPEKPWVESEVLHRDLPNHIAKEKVSEMGYEMPSPNKRTSAFRGALATVMGK